MRTTKIGIEHALVADDILVFDPNGPLRNYAHSMSGSFTWPSGVTPGSILVNRGVSVCENACHAWLGYPETVVYRYKNGTFGQGRYKSASEIPGRENVLWAVGGVGMLLTYGPVAEGFCKGVRADGVPYNYSDVLRQTAHTVLAIKAGQCYGIYIHSKTAYQVNQFLKLHGFSMAVMLDGGHIPAMNGDTEESKINMNIQQGYALQFIDHALEHRPLVAFDAGHNALNPSNQSPDGSYKEWEGNIDVVKRTMAYLTPMGIDSVFVDVLDRNQGTELSELVRRINKTGADICVSRHDNAASNPAANGMEIFCYQMTGPSLKLAECIHKEWLSLGVADRGIKDGKDLYVVKNTTMPCVLVESAFHTNPADIERLKSEEFRDKEAKALAIGIAKYFKG